MTEHRHTGDIAAEVARQLESAHLEKIAASGESFVDEAPVMITENRKALFSKVSFQWRSSDQNQLDRIRASVDTMMAHMFDNAKAVIDAFYGELRVPEIDTDTEMTVRDRSGRIVWKKDPHTGKEIEEWQQMTGQDIEKALLDLNRLKLDLSTQVNELLLEAVFAKNIADEAFQEAYAELVEETIPGRQAYAARKTSPDKFHAFFRYYLWSSAKVFLDEITHFCYVLERIRQWRISDNGSKTSFL